MDITKARKVVELSKDNTKILVTLWEGDRISSCVTEETKQRCETCQGDEGLCSEYINHLRGQGYQATEIEVGELGVEESLPQFLEEREVRVKVSPVVEAEEPEITLEEAKKEAAEEAAGRIEESWPKEA